MADQITQEIKDKLDITEVLSSYIQLKKSGTNFKAVCPFHNERTASLMVSPSKQIWHCFGCGEGGDIFGFLMRYENLDFREAIKILADRAGVQLPEFKPKDVKAEAERELLLRINDFAARFYHHILLKTSEGKAALEYLINRGLTDKTLKQWEIGFAPDNFHLLENALLKKEVKLPDAIKAGLSIQGSSGIYDRFRGRVTFPIFDYSGNVVGFSARILKNDPTSAKYVNSPETVIYSKSKILFGLNFAKEVIRKENVAVVVEGQMDAISLHQAGFVNTVATSGTALTSEQLRILGRLSKNLIFCFDADSAGTTATKRAGELALRTGFSVKVVVLPQGKDPDELVRSNPKAWEEALKEALPLLDYYLLAAQKLFAFNSVEQKKYVSGEVVPMLALLSDPLEQDHYIKKVSQSFDISEKALWESLKNKTVIATKGPESQKPVAPVNSRLLLEKQIFGGMLVFPEFLSVVKGQLDPEDLSLEELKDYVSKWFSTSELSDEARNSPLAKESSFMVESSLEEASGDAEVVLRELAKQFYLLKLQQIKQKQQVISGEIKQAEQQRDTALLGNLKSQFAEMTKQRMEFEQKI